MLSLALSLSFFCVAVIAKMLPSDPNHFSVYTLFFIMYILDMWNRVYGSIWCWLEFFIAANKRSNGIVCSLNLLFLCDTILLQLYWHTEYLSMEWFLFLFSSALLPKRIHDRNTFKLKNPCTLFVHVCVCVFYFILLQIEIENGFPLHNRSVKIYWRFWFVVKQ